MGLATDQYNEDLISPPATTALDKELNELGVCATSLTQDISNDGYDTS